MLALIRNAIIWVVSHLDSIEEFLCGSNPHLNILHFQYLCLRGRTAYIRNALSVSRNSRILDVGCGRQPFRPMVDPSSQYVGIDVYQGHPETVVINPEQPWPDLGQFDLVLSTEVAEHVRDLDPFCEQLTRSVRPGGRLIVTAPFMYPIHDEEDYWRFTAKGVESLFPAFSMIRATNAGGVFSVVVVLMLTWVANICDHRLWTKLLYALAMPVRLPLNLLLNAVALLGDRLDRTDRFFLGVIVEMERR